MGGAVDYAVHVEVEVVDGGEEGGVGDDLVYFGVALGEPAIELEVGVGGRGGERGREGKWAE